MIEFTADDFEQLCAGDLVRERIGTIEAERKAAVRKFWFRGLLGLGLSVAALVTLLSSGWEVVAFIAFAVFLIGTIVVSISPIMGAKEALKHPVLEEVAKRAGLEYIPSDFDPPVYGNARALLFGSLSSESFSDLFHGADADGRGYAAYEATLQRRSGKNSYIVFSGQIYAFHRRPGLQGYTVAVPDKKIFNFFKPARDMERVRIEGDEEFERRFEVYSTAPMEARQLFFDSDLRRELLELRKAGKVLVYLGPDAALVAATGKNRFEPGSMFRSRPGKERVKMMFDDVCASLALLKKLKERLG
jgi:hypothetical protein